MWTFFVQGERGFFRCGRPHLLAQTPQIFRNLQCVRTDNGGRGIYPVRTFFAILSGRLYGLKSKN